MGGYSLLHYCNAFQSELSKTKLMAQAVNILHNINSNASILRPCTVVPSNMALF